MWTGFFFKFVCFKLPYVTLIVVIVGLANRFLSWLTKRKAVALKNYGEKSLRKFLWAIRFFLTDMVFLRKLLYQKKLLWFLLILFHFSAAAILFGHLRGFGVWSLNWLNFMGEEWIVFLKEELPVYLAFTSFTVLLLLLGRRIFMVKEKKISSLSDYLAISVLLLSILTGLGTRFYSTFSLSPLTIEFLPGLVLKLDEQPPIIWASLHFLFTQIFFMAIPYTKLLHIISGSLSSAFYGAYREVLTEK